MRHRILTVILLLAMAGGAIAQERDIQTIRPSKHSPYHNDIVLTGGIKSLYGLLFINGGGEYYRGPRSYTTSTDWYGSYGVQYHHNFKWWIQYGVKATAEFSRNYRYSKNWSSIDGHRNDSVWELMPSVRFTYLNRKWVRLYSGLDMGVAIQYSDDKLYEPGHTGKYLESHFAFNMTPIGINVGKKVYGMFEFNIGAASFIKFGIGYRL